MLAPQAGALLCQKCGEAVAAPPLCAGAVQSMRQLASLPLTRIPSVKISAVMMEEIEHSLAHFLDYHLDYSSKAKRILSQLLD